MPIPTDPITAIADAVMRAFKVLNDRARPDSPFAQAREALGEGFLDVAVQALRAETKALLLSRDEVLAELDQAGQAGELAAETRVLGIAQAAVAAVIQEGSA